MTPGRFIPCSGFCRTGDPPDMVAAFVSGEQLAAVPQSGGRWRLPRAEELGLTEARYLGVGVWNERRIGALELPADWRSPDGIELVKLRSFNYQSDAPCVNAVCRARMLIYWDKKRRYCGACGAPAVDSDRELAKTCPACGAVFFPVVAPAVIVRIERGERILLAHNRKFPSGMCSLIAGFVESGETLEEAARREIAEETAIEVRNLRYFGSQSWPYPNSLMVGFTAEYAGGDLQADGAENDLADWYSPDALPPLPEYGSIARTMIDDWLKRFEQS